MTDESRKPPSPVETVSEMMSALELLYAQVEAGSIEESRGKLLLKIREGQLKTAELQIRYHRIMKGRLPDPEMRLITPVKPENK